MLTPIPNEVKLKEREMNINDLTIGQAKELAVLFGNQGRWIEKQFTQDLLMFWASNIIRQK